MSARGRAAILLSLGALALGAAGCGDDEDEPTQPTVTAPQTVEPLPPAETNTAPETETTAPGGVKVPPAKSDSPANDVPPPAGSPQEQFERFCEQNPEACG